MLHVDCIENQWGNRQQVRRGTITADYPLRPDLEEHWLRKTMQDGSYFFITEPHDEEHCLFRDSDRLDMQPFDVRVS